MTYTLKDNQNARYLLCAESNQKLDQANQSLFFIDQYMRENDGLRFASNRLVAVYDKSTDDLKIGRDIIGFTEPEPANGVLVLDIVRGRKINTIIELSSFDELSQLDLPMLYQVTKKFAEAQGFCATGCLRVEILMAAGSNNRYDLRIGVDLPVAD